MAKTMVCDTCKSTNVLRDAWAVWDMDNQEWVLENIFDMGVCCECDGECSIEEMEVTE